MSERRRIVVATCRQWPELSVSDATLARELERRGHEVVALPWNGTPTSDLTSADIVVLRSNWDFHHDLAAFDDWLSIVDESDAELHNPARLVRQHNDKSYLHRYIEFGIPAPATLTLDSFDAESIRMWANDRGLDTVVIKPAWGASGHDVERVSVSGLDAAWKRWVAKTDRRGVVVQEFLPQVRSGETAMVFFANQFSHALARRAVGDDFRVNSQYGGTMTLAPLVGQQALELASGVFDVLATTTTYARIDVVGSGADLRLMEVEVNEPALGLHLAPGSASRFADALLHSGGF